MSYISKSSAIASTCLIVSLLSWFSSMAQNDLDGRKVYYDQVYAEAVRTNNPMIFAEAYYLYGKHYEAKGEYKKAAEYLHKALEIHDDYPPTFAHGRVYMWLSRIAMNFGNPKSAVEYAEKSEDIFRKAGSEDGLNRIAGHFKSLKIQGAQLDSQRVRNFSPAPLDSADVYNMLLIEAEEGFQKKEYAEVYPKYRQVVRYAITNNDPNIALHAGLAAAECEMELGMLNESKVTLKMCKDSIKKYYANHLSLNIHLRYTQERLAKAEGDWKHAYELAENRHHLQNQLVKNNETGAISELNIAYQTEEKEELITYQAQDLEQRNKFLLTLTVFAVILIGISVFLYRLFQKSKKLEIRNAWLLKEQNHRIKNNLQAIKSLLNMQSRRLSDGDVKRTVEESKLRIEAMALLQRMLYEDESNSSITVPSKRFITELTKGVLSAYDSKDKNITTGFNIQDMPLIPEVTMPIGLILTEVLTNSLKYAFSEQKEGIIQVNFERTANSSFKLSVFDNGVGFDYASVDKNSFGMRLINIQVQQLNGNFTFEHKNGTVFTMNGEFI